VPALPCPALHSQAMPALPCPALPGRAMPRLPCRAQPSLARPCLPCRALPCLAFPAVPCLPRLAQPSNPGFASPALPPEPSAPCPASPALQIRARSRRASPALPCLPSRAEPGLAAPSLARPRLPGLPLLYFLSQRHRYSLLDRSRTYRLIEHSDGFLILFCGTFTANILYCESAPAHAG